MQFGGNVQFGEQERQKQLDAIDAARAIGIEWDIIDRDYYTDLGIFGDHTL